MNLTGAIQLKVSRRFLLFTAAFVWTFAAFMLISRGISLSYTIRSSYWLKIIISLSAGGLFYMLLFSKISRKHISRIINLEDDNSSIFSFFSARSYILMIIMITSGILLRKSGIIRPEYLALFYITMGIPLMVSALRFYYHGIIYR